MRYLGLHDFGDNTKEAAQDCFTQAGYPDQQVLMILRRRLLPASGQTLATSLRYQGAGLGDCQLVVAIVPPAVHTL